MRIRLSAITMIVILAAAGCSKSSTPTPTTAPTAAPTKAGGGGGDKAATITVGGETANNHGEASVAGQKSIEVEMDDFYFSPTVIKGEASQTITIELKNQGSALHNFSVQAFNETIDQDVKPGETKKVKVQFGNVLDSIAVFECKYHASQGMRGALEVPR